MWSRLLQGFKSIAAMRRHYDQEFLKRFREEMRKCPKK